MFEPFKNSSELNKSTYIYNKHQQIEEILSDLENKDPLIKVFKKHKILMEQNNFNWIHEAEIEKLNFPNLKTFLKNFLTCFSRETDKQFRMSHFFKKVFPIDVIFLYFKNLNLSFGNKVYDESLRFKTQLLICFQEFYVNTDFIDNFRIKFEQKFDFDRETRNFQRKVNRDEIVALYENENFSLKTFIFYLLDNYYPRVGWRWIGASHFIYYITLSLIVDLFELGYWQVQDFDHLLLKLYEISEVLVSLEKNSSKDSDHLAENFNKELIAGFSKAREYLTLIIIHSYQLLIDKRVKAEKVDNYKYFFNMIITRYIFNSTKIKGENLRNRNHLQQIIFYLNQDNFEYDPSPLPIEDINPELDQNFQQVYQILDDMYTIIINNEIEKSNFQYQLYEKFFDVMKILFSKYKEEKVPLEQLLASKILKKLLPLIDILKNSFPNDIESHIDLTFSLINLLCVEYPQLFKSDYFKTIIKDFFEIEPLKNLYTIQKLVTEDNLQLNNYFLEFLTIIFTRNFDNMMKIYQNDCTEINSNIEYFMGITELFIKYFDHFNENSIDNVFMELKMQINSKIEKSFLNQVIKIIDDLDVKSTVVNQTYEQIMQLSDESEKIKGLRTKQAYLMLKLYNITIHNTYKIEKVEVENLTQFLKFSPGYHITNETYKLFTQNILYANNVILNRLDINKSQHFILMENSFPLTDKDIAFLFQCYQKVFDPQEVQHLEGNQLENYLFEYTFPILYKFIHGFVYLNDESKVFDYEDQIDQILNKILKLLEKLGILKEDEISVKKQEILEGEMNKNKKIYKILQETQTSYTNHTRIKHIFYNIIYYLKQIYPPQYKRYINQYTRKKYQPRFEIANFGDNLVDIIIKTENISQIDSEESMKNLILYFIEEFRNCQLEIKFLKFRDPNYFVFLRDEYFDLICTLKIIFNKSLRYKKIFIDLIKKEEVEVKQKFFTKFWDYYRNTLFFSAYNFFHNNLWQKVSRVFIELSDFLLQLTQDDLNEPNQILQYFFKFQLVTSFHNNHVLYFQIYVILECLGNYNKLLHLKDIVRIEQKQSIFFVIQKLFQVLSNILKYPEAQLKIYVYRIDIWMNLLIRNISDISSPFYTLKNCLTDYFLSIAGGENSQIVKFYGANVNPELLKSSINKLFEMLLRKHDMVDWVITKPKQIHQKLNNHLIYSILKKQYQFYNILIRYDVQTNYLNSFMERQLESLDKNMIKSQYLIDHNLLWFYYASIIFTKFYFNVDKEFYNVCEILKPENKINIYPILIDLVRNKKLKLKDLILHHYEQKEGKLENMNNKLSVVLQTMRNQVNLTKDKSILLEKIMEDDFEWIQKNILNDQLIQ